MIRMGWSECGACSNGLSGLSGVFSDSAVQTAALEGRRRKVPIRFNAEGAEVFSAEDAENAGRSDKTGECA